MNGLDMRDVIAAIDDIDPEHRYIIASEQYDETRICIRDVPRGRSILDEGDHEEIIHDRNHPESHGWRQAILNDLLKIWEKLCDHEGEAILNDLAPWPADLRERSENTPWDVLAWYMDFHSYQENWGIVIRADGLRWLAGRLLGHWFQLFGTHSGRSPQIICATAFDAAKEMLFQHEFFHHKVECMATRMELLEQRPLYRPYTYNVYQPNLGTDDLLEEALANAYMIPATLRKFKDPEVRNWVSHWFDATIPHDPPGYRLGPQILANQSWHSECARLLSAIQNGKLRPQGFSLRGQALTQSLLTPFHGCRTRTWVQVNPTSRWSMRQCPACGYPKYARLGWGAIWLSPSNPPHPSTKSLEAKWDKGEIPMIPMGDMNTGQQWCCLRCDVMW